jgi:hypothetical protein
MFTRRLVNAGGVGVGGVVSMWDLVWGYEVGGKFVRRGITPDVRARSSPSEIKRSAASGGVFP